MNEEIKMRVAKDYTMLGDPIPNSKFYRTFCWSCFEPLRTTMHEIHNPIYCEVCDEKKPELFLDLRDLHNYPSSDEYSGRPAFDKLEGKYNGCGVDSFEKKVRRKY